MKYAIINTDKQTPFIQERFDSLEDVEKKLAILKAKNADRYPIAIVGVDDDGSFHGLVAEEKEPA
jgi:hypothetical protein